MTAGGAPPRARGRSVVIGVGNEFRRDDGAGPAVVARLRGGLPAEVELLVSDGDPARLIEAWSGADVAVVVDAVRADPPHPGRLHRLVLDRLGTRVATTGADAGAAARPAADPQTAAAARACPARGAATGTVGPGGGSPGQGGSPRAVPPGPGGSPGPDTGSLASTHRLGLADAVGLALALDRMPGLLIVHAIEAADVGHGTEMTPAVRTAVAAAADAVRRDVSGGTRPGQPGTPPGAAGLAQPSG